MSRPLERNGGRYASTVKHISMVAAVLASAVMLSSCSARQKEPASPSASSSGVVTATQEPNAAIKDLLSLDHEGVHCFATPADAVAAQLRASKAADADNGRVDKQIRDDKKPSTDNYLYVSDVGAGNFSALCYAVTTGGLH